MDGKAKKKEKRKLELYAFFEVCNLFLLLLFKEKMAEQCATFKAEENELMMAIEEQEKENAKLKKDLKA